MLAEHIEKLSALSIMVYEWEDKREICRRLYVDEKRTTAQIMEYMLREMNFQPSKRAYEKQFQRWGFPSKITRLSDPDGVLARVRELWRKNTSQKDMVETLRAEGLEVNERTIMRLRSKHGLLLRNPNPITASIGSPNGPNDATSVNATDTAALESTSAAWIRTDDDLQPPPQPQTEPSDLIKGLCMVQAATLTDGPGVIPTTNATRKRRDDLEAEDQAKWSSRKRRRHTRSFAGLPADAPGPPRYPSETTIGESQAMLQLDLARYRVTRERFKSLCLERGILKKTECGAHVWETAKKDVIDADPELQVLFQSATPSTNTSTQRPDVSRLHIALDVICMDVTKHLRIDQRRMTLSEAKNRLGVDPARSQQLRTRLFGLLQSNGFVNKYESQNGEDLKGQWLAESGLKALVDDAPVGLERQECLRAVQMLYRDYMKRWRDAAVKHSADSSAAPVISATYDAVAPTAVMAIASSVQVPDDNNPPDVALSPPTSVDAEASPAAPPIDPSLIQAAQQSSAMMASSWSGTRTIEQPARSHYFPSPVPLYFHRSTVSRDSEPGEPKSWFGALSICRVRTLRKEAIDGYIKSRSSSSLTRADLKHDRPTIERLEGLAPAPASAAAPAPAPTSSLLTHDDTHDETRGDKSHQFNGTEWITFAIDGDDELRVYLDYIRAVMLDPADSDDHHRQKSVVEGKATFVVTFANGTGIASRTSRAGVGMDFVHTTTDSPHPARS